MLIKSALEAVGHTPLLEIDPRVHGLRHINLYAKLEHLNPFGSLKDRPALNILKDEITGIQNNSQTVIESSSGNMAKAMQQICSMHDVPFRVVTNRIPVTEVKQVLQILGAEISEFPAMSSCPDPNDPNNPIAYIEREMAAHPGKYFHTSQFTNERNLEVHRDNTGPEIVTDLAATGRSVDYFITGMGTTGSSRGVGEYLLSVNPNTSIVGVVARKGHVIPGIRNADEMHEVGLFKKSFYSHVLEISTDEAIDGLLMLARKQGVLAGPSSGAAFTAAIKHLHVIDQKLARRRTKGKHNAVIIVCDRLEWYLSYLQKYRPELFGLTRKQTPRHMSDEEAATAPQVTAEQANVMLSANSNCFVVDLRGSIAYKAGTLRGAINIPADRLEEICEFGVPFPSTHQVLLVCPTGDQSRKFAAHLTKHGITCASLKGGFVAWRDAGLLIERPIKQ